MHTFILWTVFFASNLLKLIWDYCVWLQSIEFHERGKKHKENVQRRIEEVINSVFRSILCPNIPIIVIILKVLSLCFAQVQKKGREAVKVQKQLQNDLAAIEEVL